jgi:peptidyl-prolyl cis-trans isomerase B (cyclophilin B)
MQLATSLMLFSVLIPGRIWYSPEQPLNLTVKTESPVTLILTDFEGKQPIDAKPVEVAATREIDLRAQYAELAKPGTYVLWAVPKGKGIGEFAGTPVVIEVRWEKRPGFAPDPVVVRMEPLRYAVMSLEQGEVTMAFYYDVAPNTVDNFLSLAGEGYYDGLTFHRIVPGFVVQGGDPKGTGNGGPGYQIDAEFSDRKHEEGVLSMARNGDPMEQQGMKPRGEYANSAGSQFFIVLEYKQHLDAKYTAFGKVTAGMEAVAAIAKTPLADPAAGRPQKAPVIKKIEVKVVTAGNNPYEALMAKLRQVKVEKE